MQDIVIIIGIGEIGGIFARGFLKSGYTVVPVNRNSNISDIHTQYPEPAHVIVAVGETSLQETLKSLPNSWTKKVSLLQNELLPGDYSQLPNPTIISIWFEKKKGQDALEIIPSPVFGPDANIINEILSNIDLNTKIIASDKEMLNQLVIKNLYILTSNIAGLVVGGTVGELWDKHQELCNKIIDDVLLIQQALCHQPLNKQVLIEDMLLAFNGDPNHKCMGRSAPARLARALDTASKLNLNVPTLSSISMSLEDKA